MKTLKYLCCLSYFITSIGLKAQDIDLSNKESKFKIGVSVGYDKPLVSFKFNHIGYRPGLNLNLNTSYFFNKNFGLGLDFDFLNNSPNSLLGATLLYDQDPSEVVTERLSIKRNFIGLGPSFKKEINRNFNIGIGIRGGVSFINGGDLVASAKNPVTSENDFHLIQTGFNDYALSTKAMLSIEYFLTSSLGLKMNLYYLQHFNVNVDSDFDIENIGNIGIVYGSSDFDVNGDQFSLSDRDALVMTDNFCGKYSSIGANIGLIYRFGSKGHNNEKVSTSQSLIITVRDGPSQKIIPNADVLVKNTKGEIVALQTSNSFGLVQIENLRPGDYVIEGSILGVKTTSTNVFEKDFSNPIIRKEILYEDLRFILKGVTMNKSTKNAEPNVVVNLTNNSRNNITQDNSNGKGQFEFRLDPSSTYEVVGVKENRLSDINTVKTIGLTRSTTLFVELQLGLDGFECGQGTILDIKYEFDKSELLPESKFELDRLVRYMRDHDVSRVELSSHTDSRGSNEYNLYLSEERANSAVKYIVSRGVPASRIYAKGFGETSLLNQCKDGIKCSEEEHKINRRTEAKLLCK